MAGQEAHAFIARARAQSEDSVRAKLTAVSDLKRVFSVNTMVRSDIMLMLYKTNVENMLVRRRIRCVRSSSMPSLKNPACVTTNCNRLYDSISVRRSMQMQNAPEI